MHNFKNVLIENYYKTLQSYVTDWFFNITDNYSYSKLHPINASIPRIKSYKDRYYTCYTQRIYQSMNESVVQHVVEESLE